MCIKKSKSVLSADSIALCEACMMEQEQAANKNSAASFVGLVFILFYIASGFSPLWSLCITCSSDGKRVFERV